MRDVPQSHTHSNWDAKEALMADCKIAIVYFSATNVTHTYAGVMKKQ
ncbi:MAG: hypothetical protein JRF40_15560 [Deltaproteobacteria bacterium]|nr:hypothetical protein [Deltaproteobacteria bacterium]